jgi:serine/threonine protein kinase
VPTRSGPSWLNGAANIKVRPDGTIKILDFGLAKALSPTDVPWAFGVVLYEMLTGRLASRRRRSPTRSRA